ncbi:MAG: hypothetical protein AB8G86_21250 [Saprospiraceae bacterium]
MRIHLFICLLSTLLFMACKETPKNTTTVEKVSTTKEIPPEMESDPIPVSPNLEMPELQQAIPLTAYAQQFFTNTYWHYEAAVVIKNPERGKDYIGKWIKLNADNTLETGFYDGPVTKGNWILDEGKNIITFVENDAQSVYNEWQVKTSSSSDAIMIWIGTKRFNQNNIQIKMLRYNDKPSKGN